MYPYVIPFSGASLAQDASLAALYGVRHGAAWQERSVEWDQPSKILPIDPTVSAVILQIERDFEGTLASARGRMAHICLRGCARSCGSCAPCL